MSARTMFVKALAVSFRYANTGIGSSSFTWGAATAGAVGWTMTGACLLFRTFIRGSGFRVPRQSPLLLVRIPQRPAPCECHPGMRRRPLPGLVPRKYFPPPSGLCEEGCRDSASLLSAFVLRAAKKSPEGSSFMILSCRVLWEFPRIGACFAVPDFNTAFISLLPELQPAQLSLSIASRSAAACSWLFTRIVRMPKYSAIGRFR